MFEFPCCEEGWFVVFVVVRGAYGGGENMALSPLRSCSFSSLLFH